MRRYVLVVWVGVICLLAGCATVDQLTGGKDMVTAVADPCRAEPSTLQMAREDQEELFKRALAGYRENIRDYQCRMSRRGRQFGILGAAQEMDVKFLDDPFSVFLHWRKNAGKADKVLYVEGQHEGKMMALPVLIGWLTGPMAFDPEGPEARKSSPRPLTQFGFGNMLERIGSVYETGELSDGGSFTDSFGGMVEVGGREALAIERRRDGPAPEDGDQEVLWRICLDAENLMPIAVTSFNKDDGIEADYVFTDIRYNTGLRAEDFTLEAVGMAKGKK